MQYIYVCVKGATEYTFLVISFTSLQIVCVVCSQLLLLPPERLLFSPTA